MDSMIRTEEVAPLAGAWIEISFFPQLFRCRLVAPLAGAWIEIDTVNHSTQLVMSHPSRVRGLKFQLHGIPEALQRVAPLAGAWIEIPLTTRCT